MFFVLIAKINKIHDDKSFCITGNG